MFFFSRVFNMRVEKVLVNHRIMVKNILSSFAGSYEGTLHMFTYHSNSSSKSRRGMSCGELDTKILFGDKHSNTSLVAWWGTESSPSYENQLAKNKRIKLSVYTRWVQEVSNK